jgi:hypothetical protein
VVPGLLLFALLNLVLESVGGGVNSLPELLPSSAPGSLGEEIS